MSINGYINGATVHFEPEPATALRLQAEVAQAEFMYGLFSGATDLRTMKKKGDAFLEAVGKLRASGEEW